MGERRNGGQIQSTLDYSVNGCGGGKPVTPKGPTAWLEITMTEGRKRQVRHMTAAVGLPTLRLARIAVGPVTLRHLGPGQWRALEKIELESIIGRK